MKRKYQIVKANGRGKLSQKDQQELTKFLAKDGQGLMFAVDLIEQAQVAVDELLDVFGRAVIETVLNLSAQNIAGPKHPGKVGRGVRWHGKQEGTVALSNRKLRVSRPRLRRKGRGQGGEVSLPAYASMQDDQLFGARVEEILMSGVSTRNYAGVIGAMADTVGVERSSVSRRFIEAGTAALKSICERRFDDVEILIVYIDGQRFAEHHVISAVGVDVEGYKHVLGIYAGATENSTVVGALLQDLVERGLKPNRKRLFIIDGSKALRCAIDAVFGGDNPVQRCRNHKVNKVADYLPDELKDQVKSVMKAAYRLDYKEGMNKLEQQAKWLEHEYPSAAASLREGLEETFTVNRLGLTKTLRRCLCTTNLIESPHSGVRMRTNRVSRWRGQGMVLYWAAAAWSETEKHFRRVQGYQDLWILKSALDEDQVENQRKVG